MNFKNKIWLLMAMLFPALAFSQADSVHFTIDSVEHLFLKNNLALIAQKYEIEAARAAIIQAKLFQNPVVYYEQFISTPFKGEYFSPDVYSTNMLQVQQLFYLGGKRRKRISIERINTKMNEYEYYDLLRTLKYQLYTSFYQLHYYLQALKVYNRQLVSAQQIAKTMDEQYKKGNISLKELTRIKALVFSLESGRLDVTNSILEKQSVLKILTHAPAKDFIVPESNDSKVEALSLSAVTLPQVLSASDSGRYDLRGSALAIEREQANYVYQKSLAVPDFSLGITYDQAGNFVRNYTGIGLQVPLPLWNRNQGNIRIEKNLVEERKVQYEEMKNEVYNEITQAYAKALESEKLYKNFDKTFAQDYEKLITGITMEYQKRNIGLLEFLDYYQTYTQSMSDLIHLRSLRIEALEGLNMAAGTTVIK